MHPFSHTVCVTCACDMPVVKSAHRFSLKKEAWRTNCGAIHRTSAWQCSSTGTAGGPTRPTPSPGRRVVFTVGRGERGEQSGSQKLPRLEGFQGLAPNPRPYHLLSGPTPSLSLLRTNLSPNGLSPWPWGPSFCLFSLPQSSSRVSDCFLHSLTTEVADTLINFTPIPFLTETGESVLHEFVPVSLCVDVLVTHLNWI